MSGPLSVPVGSSDGVDWAERADLAAPMIAPATTHSNDLTPPDYWVGAVPYYGDFQLTPNGIAPMMLVIEFSTPIKQIRSTAQFVGGSGMSMHAVVQESDFGPGGTFVAAAQVSWNANTSGTRTLTYEPGFSFVVFRSIATSPTMGSLNAGPTFRKTYFFEELPVIEPFQAAEPDLRVPRGAGRLVSLMWPHFDWPGFTNPPGISIRPKAAADAVMLQGVIGSPPATAQAKYRGANVLMVPATNGTGYVHAPLTGDARPYHMYIATERMLKANLDGLDELACYRLVATLAFENPLGVINGDCGLVIGPGVNTQIRSGGNQAGISFGLRGPDTIGFSSRQVDGGALTDYPALVLPADFDLEDHHQYEIRLLSATSAKEALVKFVIDEEVVGEISWGAGTLLPVPENATAFGYYWSVNNRDSSPGITSRMYVQIGGVGMHGGMTEDSLL